jgi:ATP-dependent Clp protease protease subunit
MATVPNPAPPIPETVYATFCGDIAQISAAKVVAGLTNAMGAKSKHIHLLFQTAGGYVGDGVFLYNFFRAVPIELTLYNVGQISSAGVVAFLGAKNRKTSKNATFMIHRSASSPQFATSAKLGHVAKTLVLDDARIEAIIRNHVNFPPELWQAIDHSDLYISGEEAVKFGLADEVAEFAPPLGVQVYNILG